MSAEIHLLAGDPDPLPVHIRNRINSKIAALSVESHTLRDHWDNLPKEAREATIVEVKNLSRTLYELTLTVKKGASR